MLLLKAVIAVLSALPAADAAAILNVRNKKDIITDSYIVVLKNDISTEDFKSHVAWATGVHNANVAKRDIPLAGMERTFEMDIFKGYSGAFDRATVDDLLKNDKVAYIEPDRMASLQGWSTQQHAPSWGLGRISHEQRGNFDYVFDSSAGEGITIYGVDSGIDINHEEFGGRAYWGANFVDDVDFDQHGHGTHTAGTFGGSFHGVAKKANLVAVKVLNAQGKGPWSGMIDGLQWVVNDARNRGLLGRAVINFSVGGDIMTSVNNALTAAHNAGVFVSAAAGNDGDDALNYTPGTADDICVIGNMNENDYRWTGPGASNWGSRIDLWAPGTNIQSALPNGGYGGMTGTSMAAPHVAGSVAVLMSSRGVSVGDACNVLKDMATPSIFEPGPGSTNRLLYNGSGQ
ncbi:pen c 1 [Arthroderma uncinatum]|uniref:pen c 1 n=1 Tax=Arthroderma uncinatum TaxID=74035 RepID=UPI00144A5CD1|nr:pen c 1 [Arthroderma uncinatum]KAF3482100.1 pen c 1 [Arthroderma uncinatum]